MTWIMYLLVVVHSFDAIEVCMFWIH